MTSPRNSALTHRWLYFFFLVGGCSAYLYANLFTFSGTPYLFGGDQVFFWADALRLMQGKRPYIDFFQFTTPGTDFFYLALFRLFGARIWVTDLAILLCGCVLCLVCFALASRIMERRDALLATALFLVLDYGRILDATHHWFSLVAVIGALGIILGGRTQGRLAMCGLLLGIASFFTQTTGVAALIGISIALLFDRTGPVKSNQHCPRLQLILATSFAATFGLLMTPFVWQAGWKQLWYMCVVYASHNVFYMEHFFSPVAILDDLHRNRLIEVERLILLIAVTGIYIRLLWPDRNEGNESTGPNRPKVRILALTGAMLLATALIKPNWNRVYMALMPGIILLVWFCTRSRRIARSTRAVLWLTVALVGYRQLRFVHRQARVALDMPGGRAALADQRNVDEFAWLAHHTKPGDPLVQAATLNIFLPLELYDPLYVDGLWLKNTPPQFVESSIYQVEKYQVKYVIWKPQVVGPVAGTLSGEDPLAAFRSYLLHHYVLVQTFANGEEAWQRLPG